MNVSLQKYSGVGIFTSFVPVLFFISVMTINITVLKGQTNIDIPTVFTPNNDNVNDEFSINLNGINVTDYSMKIYNRWGVLMFSSQNSNINWDGRTAAGIKVSEGNYYYVVVINGIPYKGAVLLIY
jgi:gliding motility-associated-like protein